MGQITNFPNTVNVGVLSIADVAVTATAAQINASVGGGVSNVTAATYTAGSADIGKIITLNRAAGVAVTLPAATGSGAVYKFFVGTTVTSLSTTITRAGSDTMFGNAFAAQSGGTTVLAFEAAASTTITFNGGTTGGIKGDFVTLTDVAAATWGVLINGSSVGAGATPFS